MQSLCGFMYSNVSPATFAQREAQLTSTFQVRITPCELVNAGLFVRMVWHVVNCMR